MYFATVYSAGLLDSREGFFVVSRFLGLALGLEIGER
jgi:hypothetical protein